MVDPVRVPGVGDFEFPNYFEIGRMNLRETLRITGKESLADNDTYVEAYIYALDETADPIKRQLSMNFIFEALGTAGAGDGGPTTAQQAAGIEAELTNLASMLGVSNQDWSAISWQAAKNNWTTTMMRDHVANLIDASSLQRSGVVKDIGVKSRDAAAKYFMKVSDDDVLGWARAIASGDMDEQSIVTTIRDRAKAQYHWLAPVLDQGVTLEEYFKPHREEISKLLEVSPDSIDFMNDAKWQSVVRRTPDDMDGTERAMNLNETAKYVRSMDEWKNTSNAKATASTAVSSIGRVLGVL
jgi:hypothetical protein